MLNIDKNLKELKTMLVTGKTFGDTFSSFMDISEQPGFFSFGDKSQNPILEKIIETVLEQYFKTDVKVSHLLIVEIKEHDFFHGPFFANGRMASFFFFEDIDVGMISIVMNPGTSETSFLRFSTMQFEGKDKNKEHYFVPPTSKNLQ